MTPDEVEALSDDEYDAFVRLMKLEAREIQKAARTRRTSRR
jgi:hypothetical protein